MKRTLLLGYQWLTALSDAGTGIMLLLAPEFTLRMMGVQAPADAIVYISYIGAFVFSVGLACLYGVRLLTRRCEPVRLETVWLITAIARAMVAAYVASSVATLRLEPGWIGVALFDGACAVVQGVGVRKGWLRASCQ